MSNQIENSIFGVCNNNESMIEVCGDYTNWYNEECNSLEDCTILKFEGMTIESIDEESIILEIVDNDWYIQDLDTIGNTEYHLDAEKLKSILGEIDVESAIEHLQEMGKVVIGNCDVYELKELLETKGYITEIDSRDRDYLVLIEKVITIEEIAENLIGNSIDDVIEIFGNYSYEGITEIILNEINAGFYSHTAYANNKTAPEILMLVDEEGMITSADVKC